MRLTVSVILPGGKCQFCGDIWRREINVNLDRAVYKTTTCPKKIDPIRIRIFKKKFKKLQKIDLRLKKVQIKFQKIEKISRKSWQILKRIRKITVKKLKIQKRNSQKTIIKGQDFKILKVRNFFIYLPRWRMVYVKTISYKIDFTEKIYR